MTWTKRLKGLVIAFAILIVCIPLTAITVLLLMPVLNWLEGRFTLELVGHSGPAEWLILVIYFVLVAIAIMIWSKSGKSADDW